MRKLSTAQLNMAVWTPVFVRLRAWNRAEFG